MAIFGTAFYLVVAIFITRIMARIPVPSDREILEICYLDHSARQQQETAAAAVTKTTEAVDITAECSRHPQHSYPT
jgi:hypothetical protein